RREARRRSGGAGVGPWLTLASYLSLLLVWVLAARAAPNLIPGPVETLQFVAREYQRGVLIKHLLVTTQRVLSAFAVGMVLGVAAGAAMGASKRVDDLLQGWLVVFLTIPRILLFVVAYLTIGLSDQALVVALVITIVPTIVVAVREGARAIDGSLVEMARAFRRSPAATWLHVVLPQLVPYIVGTARGALALAWKMVVLGELLGRTSGVGYQSSCCVPFLTRTGIRASGVTMMVLLAVLDVGVMGVVQRVAFRWRARGRVTAVGWWLRSTSAA